MQKKINVVIWIIAIVLLVLIIFMFFKEQNKMILKTKSYFYMNTQIYVKLYGKDHKKLDKALTEIDKMYEYYHNVSDRFNHHEGIQGVYYIKNNQENDNITIDENLYDMLKLSQEWYQKSNHLFDISLGDVIDIWSKYREKQNGVPSLEELKSVSASMMDKLVLLENNQIQNNHLNLDLGGVAKGYATEKVSQMLDDLGINQYIINAGGNVIVGEKYDKNNYSIGIEDPNSQSGEIFKIVYGEDISVVTSGGYERFYEYQGKKYHHIIHPNTLYPSEYSKSVTVITKNSGVADILSTLLFLMPIDEGMAFVEKLEDTEAIWFTNDDLIVSSSGVSNYEKK